MVAHDAMERGSILLDSRERRISTAERQGVQSSNEQAGCAVQ